MSEDGSEESTNGDQEVENSPQKSPAPGEKSPGQDSSSSSAHADDEGGSPCSSTNGGGGGGGSGSRLDSSAAGGEGASGSGSTAAAATGVTERPASSETPQGFRRVAKNNCARTDLVYIHPPAAERELAASTTKVTICADSAVLWYPRNIGMLIQQFYCA